jgi:hypothetical protein
LGDIGAAEMRRSGVENYKWEAITLEGFIQQLAVGYVARRYFFYVRGCVPERLGTSEHDHRMLEKFKVARSKWSRYRRTKRNGPDGRPLANVQYLRHRNFWVLLATAGHHRFFVEHQRMESDGVTTLRQYRDVRLAPICYGGYSVGHRNGKASVRIDRAACRQLKGHFLRLALRGRPTELLEREFRHSPFEPYGGVTRQMFSILRAVNRIRKRAGLPAVPRNCVRVKRKVVKPFEDDVYRLAA